MSKEETESSVSIINSTPQSQVKKTLFSGNKSRSTYGYMQFTHTVPHPHKFLSLSLLMQMGSLISLRIQDFWEFILTSHIHIQRSNSVVYMYTRELQDKEEERELDLGSDEPDTPLPLTVTSRVNMCSFPCYSALQREEATVLWL